MNGRLYAVWGYTMAGHCGTYLIADSPEDAKARYQEIWPLVFISGVGDAIPDGWIHE